MFVLEIFASKESATLGAVPVPMPRLVESLTHL